MVKAKRLRRELLQTGTSEQLAEAIVAGMQEKKAQLITVMDLRPTGNTIADFFVICHGDSGTQVDAIARSVEDEVNKNMKENPVFKEGYQNAEWILLDYINVVVHIFLKEQRDFYGIERFWADAETRRIA